MAAQNEIQHLANLLTNDEIILPEDESYSTYTKTWSASKNFQPKVVARPATLETLSKTLRFLSQSSLEFDVRDSGVGNASSPDVVISMRAFNEFSFDRENEVVTLGAGAVWSEYYKRMEEVAPDYTVVAIRTPFVGVGGSILAGGFSWLAHEFGCTSDPQNMLDAQVVKLDGTVLWASEEPDLLWALRGVQLGLCVVTKFKLRAYKYSQNIWGGQILVPADKELEVANEIAKLEKDDNFSRKVSMFLYHTTGPLLKELGASGDMLVLHVFDALGEDHGRNLFRWALDMPGMIDTTKIMNLRGFADLQAPAEPVKGMMQSWWNGVCLRELDEDIIMKSLKWWKKIQAQGGSIASSSYMLYELFSMRGSLSPAGSSAWPRPADCRHALLLGTGCAPDASKEEVQKAIRLCEEAPREILGGTFDQSRIMANGLEEDFHDLEAVYGSHWRKLVELKKKYDPKGSFRSSVKQHLR